MSLTPVAAPVLHIQHYIEIPFTWAADRLEDDNFQFETCERIEAKAVSLCADLGLELDPAGAVSVDGIRLKGNDLCRVHAAGAELVAYLAAQEGLVFLQQVEECA